MDCREASIYTKRDQVEAVKAAQAREKSFEDKIDSSAEKWADLG